MSSQSYTKRVPYDGHFIEFLHSENVLLPTSLLIVGALMLLPYLGAPLQYAPRYVLSLMWNAFIHILPARLIFALHDYFGGSTEEAMADGSSLGLHERKRLAASEILGKVFPSDSSKILQIIPITPIATAAAGVFRIKDSEKPPGLSNPSNSCFQNSVLQGLASLGTFREFVQEASQDFGFTKASTNGALAWLMGCLNDREWQGRTLWTPTKLMPMNIVQQQDAQEYFSRIMENLEKELSQKLGSRSSNPGLAELESLLTEPKARTSSHRELSEKESHAAEARPEAALGAAERHAASMPQETPPCPIRNPVDGLLAQRLVCTQCFYSEGISLVPFNTLTVPLGQGSWRSYEVFDDCLYEYLKVEELDGVECARCTLRARQKVLRQLIESLDSAKKGVFENKLEQVESALSEEDFSEKTLVKKLGLEKRLWSRTKKTKQLAIARAPKSLVIHVQRSAFNPYTFRQEKNNSPVQFPVYQDISWFMLGGRNLSSEQVSSIWPKDSTASMLPIDEAGPQALALSPDLYRLRAVVGHSGSHDYGHYVCYRKFQPKLSKTTEAKEQRAVSHPPQVTMLECPECHESFAESSDSLPDHIRTEIESDRWWRLSDETVWEVSEDKVTEQGNAFMLFYERCEPSRRIVQNYRCQKCTALEAPNNVSLAKELAEVGEEVSEESLSTLDSLVDVNDSLPTPPASQESSPRLLADEGSHPSLVHADGDVQRARKSSLAFPQNQETPRLKRVGEEISAKHFTDLSSQDSGSAGEMMTPPFTPEPSVMADNADGSPPMIAAS